MGKTYFGTDKPGAIMEESGAVVRVSVPGTGKTLIFRDAFGALDYIGRHGLVEHIGKSSIMRECRWDDDGAFHDYVDAIVGYQTAAGYEGDADGQWAAIAELQRAKRAYRAYAEQSA